MKILYFDIENTPLTVHTWGLYEQNAVAMTKDWELLSVAYAWGDGPIEVISRQGRKSDKSLTKQLHRLIDKADIVIAHNAVKFDVRKANAKFAEHKLPPPSPYKVVDTLQIARAKFAFTSNKLDDLAKLLGVPRKMQNNGIAMWLGCMAGDKASWAQMLKYNAQDITVLRAVYKELRPWHTSHPSVAPRGVVACTHCGSRNLIMKGFFYTAASAFRRYKCKDCGGSSRSRVAEKSITSQRTVSI